VHLACSTEPVELARVKGDLDRARDDFDRRTSIVSSEVDESLETLLRAADTFVVCLPGETAGERTVQVITQYPWSSPSGRTALMGFRGLFVVPGRLEEGRALLRGLAGQMKDGLIPTEFDETGEGPSYCGADTSLWFIDAVGEYFRRTEDEKTIGALFAAVERIIDAYRQGRAPGIFCDSDGLVGMRLAGVAGSWMDAQVADWIVTPRQGRTVELNALWYNALMTAGLLASKVGKQALAWQWEELARRVQASFNRRFWNANLDCCYDVVEDDGLDASVRPNQIFAISLPHAVLAVERHRAVIQKVMEELLTPMGVRSLSARDPAFQGRYGGNVVSRDRAQHQGSVYPWLLGPLATAYAKAWGRSEETIFKISQWVAPCLDYLAGDGLGQICELFDGESPKAGRGAPASALSVAEVLRCYMQEVLGIAMAPKRARPGPSASPGAPVGSSTLE
jgi:predicted glycogen debranching enzyme